MKFLKRLAIFLATCSLLLFVWFQWWHLSKSIVPLSERVEENDLVFILASPLPMSISEAGGTAHRGKLYVVGGMDAYGRTLNKFWEFDAARNTWAQLPDVPAH